jgi:hypothetical protein
VLNRREFIAAAALSISTPLVAEAHRSALLTGSVGQIADLTVEFHTVGDVV